MTSPTTTQTFHALKGEENPVFLCSQTFNNTMCYIFFFLKYQYRDRLRELSKCLLNNYYFKHKQAIPLCSNTGSSSVWGRHVPTAALPAMPHRNHSGRQGVRSPSAHMSACMILFSRLGSHCSTSNTKLLELFSGRVLIGVQGSVSGSPCGFSAVLLPCCPPVQGQGRKHYTIVPRSLVA